MNNSLMRAIRGPIVLITLGVLLACDHMGPYGISRTWPVIIIMIGLMKLLERLFDPRPAQPQGGNQS
ncbi:MAG: hypothetical protein JJE04_04450 [Acidobacteriia bacterium]|nr:hypothetical protein [Terriglobia bacterium]